MPLRLEQPEFAVKQKGMVIQMQFIKPNALYFEEYYHACKESHENNITEWIPFELDHYDIWKKQILKVLENYEKGKDIPDGMPITHTWWCVDDKRFIGEIQIRPFLSNEEAQKWGHIAYAVRFTEWGKGYGTKLLRAAVKKINELEVSPIYVVCHKNNIGSIKVIEKNGGIFQFMFLDEEECEQNVYRMG